jgi:hypothetical protein
MAKKKQTNLPAVLTRTEILSRHPVEEVAKTAFRDGNGSVVRPVVTPRELVSAGILLRLNNYLRHLSITDPETGEIVGSADPLEQLAVLQVHPRVPPVVRVQAAKELARIIYPNGITADAGTIAQNVLDAAAAPEEKDAYVGPKRKRGRPRKTNATLTDANRHIGSQAPEAAVPAITPAEIEAMAATPVDRPDDIEPEDGDDAPILECDPEIPPTLETPLRPPKSFDIEIEPVRPIDPRIQPGWRTEDPLTKQRMLAEYLRSVQ